MNKKYYTSDLHLGHENVIMFDNRPFKSVEQMDAEILRRWNEKVDNGDTVYLLGDIVWKNGIKQIETIKHMNGQKHLVLGNHDRLNYQLKACFVSISDYKEIKDGDTRIILSHHPIHSYKNHYHDGNYGLYGHVHATQEYETVKKMQKLMQDDGFRCEMFNVGCMLHNYEPVTLEEILEKGVL